MTQETIRHYKTFKRSCTSFTTMQSARKTPIDRNLTIEEARRACAAYNDHRTPAEIQRGSKMEFTAQ